MRVKLELLRKYVIQLRKGQRGGNNGDFTPCYMRCKIEDGVVALRDFAPYKLLW